jgi:hypothetical protein
VDIIASYESVAVQSTDELRKAELLIPADAPVDWVVALKPEVGFDYFENYVAFPTTDRDPLPDSVRLVLDRALPAVEVETRTPDGEPIPGVKVGPWTIKKPGKVSYVNLSGGAGAQSSWQTTDGEGKTRFAWLPQSIDGWVTILSSHEGFHASERVHLKDQGVEGRLRITMNPNGTIRGKVALPDGSPAPNILTGRGQRRRFLLSRLCSHRGRRHVLVQCLRRPDLRREGAG